MAAEEIRVWLQSVADPKEIENDKDADDNVDGLEGQRQVELANFAEIGTEWTEVSATISCLPEGGRRRFEGFARKDSASGLVECRGEMTNENGDRLSGTWMDGYMEGAARLDAADGGFQLRSFRQGLLHGLCRSFGCARRRSDNLTLVASYWRGHRVGVVWHGLLGGGFLVEPAASQQDNAICQQCVYLYPDIDGAIIGHFKDGKLVCGHYGQVDGVSWSHGLPVPTVSALSLQLIKRDVSTNQ